jgi:hypothetical protein
MQSIRPTDKVLLNCVYSYYLANISSKIEPVGFSENAFLRQFSHKEYNPIHLIIGLHLGQCKM